MNKTHFDGIIDSKTHLTVTLPIERHYFSARYQKEMPTQKIMVSKLTLSLNIDKVHLEERDNTKEVILTIGETEVRGILTDFEQEIS